MNLKNALLISSMVLGLSGCCGGGKSNETPSRWEQPTAGKAGGPSAPAKTTASPTATTPPKADQTVLAKGAANSAFPADGTDGFKRVAAQEKEGFTLMTYTKDKDKLSMAIQDSVADASVKDKFKGVSDKVGTNPYKNFPSKKSNMLVKDRYQISVESDTVDEAGRKKWLEKFNTSSLP